MADAQEQPSEQTDQILYFKNRDAVPENQYLSNEEVYLRLIKIINPDYIEAVQKIGGLWRIYINDFQARCRLLAEGLDLGGRCVTIFQYNPFTRPTHTILRVCDVPLTVHDNDIIRTLREIGADIVGDMTKERLRVGGQLVNCLTGNRRVEIKIPKEPLPRFVAINNYKAKLFHRGQPQTQDVICSHCQEKGHYMANCRNELKCRECKNTGHTHETCKVNAKDKQVVTLKAGKLAITHHPSRVELRDAKVVEVKQVEDNDLPDELPQYHAQYTTDEAEYTTGSESSEPASEDDKEPTLRRTSSMSATSPSPGPWQMAGKRKQKVKPARNRNKVKGTR